jgi:2-oxoglutarate dehydrogenase E1 component
MSPKSLLRHPLAVSNLDEFTELNFQPLIKEIDQISAPDKVRRVVLCSGKVYYDLLAARRERKIKDVAIIRLEQLYPFPATEISAELKKFKDAEVIWCQEEPKNMGSWHFVAELIEEVLVLAKHKFSRPKYVGRTACASPATGYGSTHNKEQAEIIDLALS